MQLLFACIKMALAAFPNIRDKIGITQTCFYAKSFVEIICKRNSGPYRKAMFDVRFNVFALIEDKNT